MKIHMRTAMHVMDRNEPCSMLGVYPWCRLCLFLYGACQLLNHDGDPYENSYACDDS